MSYHIRWLIRRDMEDVLEIENQNFLEPWNEEDFARNMRKRNVIGMVIEVEEQILGFMVYELHKTRIELINFAVKKSRQGEGLGTTMIDKLKKKLSVGRRPTLSANVGEYNIGFQLFLKYLGFQCVEILRRPEGDDYRFTLTVGQKSLSNL